MQGLVIHQQTPPTTMTVGLILFRPASFTTDQTGKGCVWGVGMGKGRGGGQGLGREVEEGW